MGNWDGLADMPCGYVATALVMLMSPAFFSVLPIMLPVRSHAFPCLQACLILYAACEHSRLHSPMPTLSGRLRKMCTLNRLAPCMRAALAGYGGE